MNLNMDYEIRRINRRTKRENQTPLVIYWRGVKSYGTARLANITDYLLMQGRSHDYSSARMIVDSADLADIEAAQQAIKAARKAADKVYARAFGRGQRIDPAEAEALWKATR